MIGKKSERGLYVGNMYLELKSLYKCTKMARGQDHGKSGPGKEGFSTVCAGCEGSTSNGTRPLRSLCFTV